MPVYCQPLGLQQLATQEIADFVSKFVVQCMNLEVLQSSDFHKIPPEGSHLERSYYHKMRTYLEHVPRNFANDLTSEILIKLSDREAQVDDAVEHSFVQLCFQEMLKSIIHPEITELVMSSRWKYVMPFAAENIGSFSNLKVLVYSHHSNRVFKRYERQRIKALIAKALKGLIHLRTFIFHKICDDEIVEILCNYCKNLRRLDIYGSKCVTDASIDNILKLSNLDELDISETSIYYGQTGFLKQLSESNMELKCFRCSTLNEDQLEILSNNFTQLVDLSCELEIHSNFGSVDFSKLKSLTMLHYVSVFFEKHMFVGANLVRLVVVNHIIEVSNIIKYCPSLENLTIIADLLVIEDCPHPCLSSLQHLTLHTKNSLAATTLLSQCKNLTSLQLCVEQKFFTAHLETLLKNNEFRYLEEINLGALMGIVPPEAVVFMTEQCCSIKVCRVCACDVEKLRNLYKDYQGIDIDPELWYKLREYVGFKIERYVTFGSCCLVGHNILEYDYQ